MTYIDLCFFSYFASQSKETKFGNYFFDVCCSDVSESFLSTQSHLKFFRVRVMTWSSRVRVVFKNCPVISSHWFASSSQCRVTRNFTFFL